mgnify:CR=1 FL=1
MDIEDFGDFEDSLADEDLLMAFDAARVQSKSVGTPHALKAGQNAGSIKAGTNAAAMAIDLDDLPSDAFSSDPETSDLPIATPNGNGPSFTAPRNGLQRSQSGSFRQTTLFGQELSGDSPRLSQMVSNRPFRADLPREEPTHHSIDKEAMSTWVYPTNLGAIRDYQFSIVKNSLFNNTLVALPTGLGKTFIAATVMLNFYRWTANAKIVFVAPTKPLVAQQIDACYTIAGIPRSETTLLTGDIAPALRVDEWASKRVFFMTPQTLMNDLSHGYADPKSIVLLVVDEAHRATGEYAYAKVTKMIRRFSKSIRVLALTATPGSKVETVQEVIDNLGISHCEIRTENSIDIRPYVHDRNIDQVVLDPSDEMDRVSELFTKALKPMMDKLGSQNINYMRNPMAISAYGLMQAQKEWFATRGRHANQGVQGMMRAIFSVLTSIAHSIKLLNFHGIKPFYANLVDMRSEQEGRGEKGSKYKRQLIEDASFQEMMDIISRWVKIPDFLGHPKLEALGECVLNHFMDHGESTRVIVFSEYRDSADEIVKMLNRHKPLVKASVFVGQADGKRGEGMKQRQQIETIDRFRKGDFNVLVATSIGEEGLDIGQVDLIVCYDASASPIRMLQRMGRTGRKRAGKIILLLMRGKEEDQYARSKDGYEKMQALICEGSRFNFRFDLSTRIVPREIRPEVDKREVVIPVENTQDTSLPEPKKRRAPAGKKKPPKKFHMPDGVETGFRKVSDYLKAPAAAEKPKPKPKPKRNPELDDLVEKPSMASVVLGDDELKHLNKAYRDLPFSHGAVEETTMPSMTSQTKFQRSLRPVVGLKHGQCTKRFVKLMRRFGTNVDGLIKPRESTEANDYLDMPIREFIDSDGEVDTTEPEPLPSRKRARAVNRVEPDVPESRPAPKKAKTSNGGGSKPKTPKVTIFDAAVEEALESEEDEESDGEDIAPRTGNFKKSKARGEWSWTQEDRGGLNSDEVGEDCERDSDAVETDGSDDGSDLQDFLAPDDEIPSTHDCSSSLFLTSQPSPRPKTKAPSIAAVLFPGTQESEDLPDIDTILSGKKPREPLRQDSADEDAAVKRGARGRRQILDSESDSDD